MNATKQAETEKALQDMYTKIQQTAQDNQKAFNEQQQQKLGPVLDKVRKAIETVSKNWWLCLYYGKKVLANHCILTKPLAKILLQKLKLSLLK